MSKTIKREYCSYCHSKDNVCYFYNENNKLISKCMTPDCEYNKGNQYFNNKPIVEYAEFNKKPIIEYGEFNTIIASIEARYISARVCNNYEYYQGELNNKQFHIENYYDAKTSSTKIAQKLRWLPKEFEWRGDSKRAGFFGQQCINKNNKLLFITEGAIDCLSIVECSEDKKINVVSLKNGAGVKTTAQELLNASEFLNVFDKIILCFDKDSAGETAFSECSKLLPPKKLGHVDYFYKDANEYLQLKQKELLYTDVMNWKQYKPKTISIPSMDELRTPDKTGITTPFAMLNDSIRGIKEQRLYMVLGGSGIGKSSFTRELVFGLLNLKDPMKVGAVYLEEPIKTTGNAFIALAHNKPLYKLEENPEIVSYDAFKETYEKYIGSGLLSFVDASFMALDSKELIYNLQYLIDVNKCNCIVLDHLTMLTYDATVENNERKDIDMLMKALRELVHRTKISIIVVAHLKRPTTGKSWAEGREVQLGDGRGSAAIEQLSDVVIGLERNMLKDIEKSILKVKILKNRITGYTGYVDTLCYIENTGRLISIDK